MRLLVAALASSIALGQLVFEEPPSNALFEPEPEAESGSTAQKWFILGDWGGGSSKRQKGQKATAEGLVKKAKAVGGIDFIMGLGDNFYEKGITGNVNDKRFKVTFGSVYSDASLDVPWYHILGNHDYHGNVTAQLEYHKKDKKWNMPSRYYTVEKSFTSNGKKVTTQLIQLDGNELFGNIEDEDHETGEITLTPCPNAQADKQMVWFEKQLKESTADYLWVATHYPAFTSKGFPSKLKKLAPLLEHYKASGYFAGHSHVMEYYSKKTGGPIYGIVGCGCECNYKGIKDPNWPGYKTEYIYHKEHVVAGAFAYMEVTSTETTISYVGADGKTLHTMPTIKPRKL